MLISKKNRHHLLLMSQIMPIFAKRLDLKVNRNLKCVGDGSSDTAVSFLFILRAAGTVRTFFTAAVSWTARD